jgi:hypothetical protein
MTPETEFIQTMRARTSAMERMVISLGGRGRAIRVRQNVLRRRQLFGAMPVHVVLTAILPGLFLLLDARGQTGSSETVSSAAKAAQQSLLSRPSPGKPRASMPASTTAAAPASTTAPGHPEPAITAKSQESAPADSKRFKVRDEFGECVVARFHGQYGDKTALILPDGQLGTPNRLVPTDEPFQPKTADQLETSLRNGPFAEFHVLRTAHYLIFFKSTLAFAQDSGRVLDDLYRGLIEAFRRNGFPVHDTEFPLVAVIFATESDFRAHKQVDRQVQAYYEFFTNRIFFYEKSERDQVEPKLAALLKPQTVAHEGAHQILSNIGVQPRPCSWPPWLVEGLAEYCATTVNTKKGIVWRGMAAINSLHMVTLRELDDPLSREINGGDVHLIQVARQQATSTTESLLLRTQLTPPEYAQAWALTHYMAQKHGDVFVKYLKSLSQIPPLHPRTPTENLAEFRRFFGDDLGRLDKKLVEYIHKLSQKKGYDPLPYFTIIFAQPLGNGVIRRAATYSQSPQMIQQWVLEQTAPHGGEPNWEAVPWPTRARAILAAEEWMRQY